MTALANLGHVTPSRTVLFLGAGYNFGALRTNRQPLPMASDLAAAIVKEYKQRTGIDLHSLDLPRVSSRFLRTFKADDFLPFLRNQLDVSFTSASHKSIAAQPWLRVYSTNYDETFLLASRGGPLRWQSASHSDKCPDFLNPQTLIYVNGRLAKTKSDNFDSEIILTKESYDRDHFRSTRWYQHLIRDLRFAERIIFIGYALSDQDVSRLLFANAGLKQKTFFIDRPGISEVVAGDFAEYGSIIASGIDEFASYSEIKEPSAAAGLTPLNSFELITSPQSSRRIAPADASAQLLYGRVDLGLFGGNAWPENYVVQRNAADNAKLHLLADSNVILLANPGNGKTRCADVCSYMLAHEGQRVYGNYALDLA